MTDQHSRRDIARWAACGVGVGVSTFAVLRFVSDNRSVVGAVIGLIVAAIAVGAWRSLGPSDSMSRLRHADRRARRTGALAFGCALAISGTAVATSLPKLTIPSASPSVHGANDQAHVGLAEQADTWLKNLLAKAESVQPGSTKHVYSISADNVSVVLLVYDPVSGLCTGFAENAKGEIEPTGSSVDDSVAARTFSIDELQVSSLTSVYQDVLATTKTYPATQDKLDIVSPISGAPPVINVTLGFGTGTEQRIQANATGSIAVPFDPSGTSTAYNVAKSLLVSVGVGSYEPVVGRLVVQGSADGTVPLGESPISATGGILLEVTKAGPEGRPATIYQAPGAFPVVLYKDASTTPADAVFALDDFGPEQMHLAVDDCAKRVGGNDSDMRTVALQMGSTTVNGQDRLAVQIQLGTKPGSYAIYDKAGSLLQIGP